MKTARPGASGAGGGSVQGNVNVPQNSAPAASLQDLAVAKRVAHAEREAIRDVIIAYQRNPASILEELERLYREADRRLAAMRRAIREAGR